MDRSHTQGAQILGLSRQGRRGTLTVYGASDLDLTGARDKSDLWRAAYGDLETVQG